jgi:DNA-binding transcriptional MocR family regulator
MSATHVQVAYLLPDLDPTDKAALSAQVASFYSRAIEDGRVLVGERLPPIREVATGCKVTRATVQEAYRRLADLGLVAGTVGRGTIVLASATAASDPSHRLLSPYAEAALRRTRAMKGAPLLSENQELVANFAELAPDESFFPVDEWREAMDAVLRTRGRELLGYGHSTFGLQELRELLVVRSHDSDPELSADNLLVTAGAQQALDLVLRTVCSPGDTVVVTTPSYHHMHGLLRAHGLQVVQVPFGPDGLDHAQLSRVLARPSVRLCYLMPTFHNPTGRSLNLEQRKQLVQALADTDVAVVEDEYQHSLRCRGDALPTLRSLDARGLTVTVSTVSKDLFPALRIGWVAGSDHLLQPMAAVKRFMDLETSPLLQAALVEFMRRGFFDNHLSSLLAELRLRHKALQAACAQHLPEGCRVTDPDGGFVAWLEMPNSGQSSSGHGEQLAELAAERGVRVVPGRAFDLDGAASRGVRLCLTRSNVDQIHHGVRVLGECARELLEVHAPAQTFL